MRRLSIYALAAFVVSSLRPLAGGRDPGKGQKCRSRQATVTLTAGDADKILNVTTGAKVTGLFGKKLKKAVTQDSSGRAAGCPGLGGLAHDRGQGR